MGWTDLYRGDLGLMLSSLNMDKETRVQYLEEAVCISHCANTLGKGMNPAILAPAINK